MALLRGMNLILVATIGVIAMNDKIKEQEDEIKELKRKVYALEQHIAFIKGWMFAQTGKHYE